MNYRAVCSCMALLLSAAICSCAPAPSHRAPATAEPLAVPGHDGLTLSSPMPVDPLVTTGTLANGLRYVIRRNQKPENRAELRLAVDAGSILEKDDQQGLAHFVEHMAFNGTRHFEKQELVDYLESIGMRFGPDLNAYTSFDETVYMLTVPLDSTEFVETAFQIFEDWAQGVSFEGEEIDKERGVVIEEWRRRRGAGQRMFEKQLPIIVKGSRYAERLPIGQKAVLDTFHHETIRDFYRTWYRPDLMGFVAAGDFEVAYIESLIVEYLGRLSAPATRIPRAVYEVPDHDETLFAIATDPEATGNNVNIYHKGSVRDYQTVGAYRRSLVESLYHRMVNNRLRELTKVPDPPYIGAGSGQGRWIRGGEVFSLRAAVADGGFDRGVHTLLTEAARVRLHGFTAIELEREKKEMLRSIEQAYRERGKVPSGRFASEYLRHLLVAEPIPGIELERDLYRVLLPAIGLPDVNALGRHWTGEKNRVIALQAPQKEGVEVPGEADLLAIFDRVDETSIEPYAESVDERPLVAHPPSPGALARVDSIPEIGVTIWELSNGVTVWLKPTDFQNDQVLFAAHSPGGHSLVDDADFVPASTAVTAVLEGGVGEFTQIELEKKLAGKVAGVSPWIGETHEGMRGRASPEDAETMFQLLYAYFTSPRADPDAFQGWVTRFRGSIENRNARPETAYSDTISLTMASYHVRAEPWSLERVGKMDLARSMAIYRDRFADAGDFRFFFVGNFTLDQMAPLVTTWLGGLPSGGREETWRDVGIAGPEGKVEKFVLRGIEPKSESRIIFGGDFDYNLWNLLELQAMGQALQIKLREVLREDLGGTYSVGVGANAGQFPKQKYRITISFSSDPERVEELTDVVFEQIDSLRSHGLPQIYIDKTKEQRLRRREVQLKENNWWVGALDFVSRDGIDPRVLVRYPELVDSLTVEKVHEAAQRYFDLDEYARFVLLPEPGALAEPIGSPATGELSP